MANPSPGVRPDWVDDQLFPFESEFVDLAGNLVHYVDEGAGPTLLMLHGNPSWSYLYRHLIRELRTDFRCVALDYPGFGLSSAAPSYRFTAAEHAVVVGDFVRALDLSDLTLMVQDWGGPIGLAAAVRDSKRYRALIIGNTWAWPRDDVATKIFSRTLGGPVGRYLCEHHDFFARRIVPFGHQKTKPSPIDMAHYEGPFPDAAARIPTHVFPREILTARPLLEEVAGALETLSDLPALLIWAEKDRAFGSDDLARWQTTFNQATTTPLPDAGHYFQDDDPDATVAAIRAWWGTLEVSE